MKQFISNYWREIVILILAVSLAFLLGRGWESRFIMQMVEENQALINLKRQTERLIVNTGNKQTQDTFRRLGYAIPNTVSSNTAEQSATVPD